MAVKLYKPTTPGRRFASVATFEELTKQEPEKSLIVPNKRKAGRSHGTITVRHRGGGSKRFYRLVDFLQRRLNEPAKVLAIEYDPNRTTRIALIQFPDGEKRYILATTNMHVNDQVLVSAEKIEPTDGNRMPLAFIPVGAFVHNVELHPGRGGAIIRSAGSYGVVQAMEGDFVHLKFPSGEVRRVSKQSMASIGQLSNVDHVNVRLGKAGRMRWLRVRPTVRGKAMNPVDHPHGGGEGHNPIGLKHPKTPWGKPALGVKTRKKGKYSDRHIIERRK